VQSVDPKYALHDAFGVEGDEEFDGEEDVEDELGHKEALRCDIGGGVSILNLLKLLIVVANGEGDEVQECNRTGGGVSVVLGEVDQKDFPDAISFLVIRLVLIPLLLDLQLLEVVTRDQLRVEKDLLHVLPLDQTRVLTVHEDQKLLYLGILLQKFSAHTCLEFKGGDVAATINVDLLELVLEELVALALEVEDLVGGPVLVVIVEHSQ